MMLLSVAAFTAIFALACGTDAASGPTVTPTPGQPTSTPATETPTQAPATPTPTATPTASPVTPTPYVDFHPLMGQPFKLPMGGTAYLNAEGGRIRFVRVVSDNRCPLDVTCITGGAVVVEMAVRVSASAPEELVLWSIGADKTEPSERTITGLNIELLEVEPVPGGPNPDGPVQVELVVTAAPSAPVLDLDATVSESEVTVGETFVVTTDAGGSGIPQYSLWIGDVTVSVLNYSGGEVRSAESDLAEVVSFDSAMSFATWVLRPLSAGTLDVRVSVNGEVQVGPGGPFMFTSGEEPFTVTVTG